MLSIVRRKLTRNSTLLLFRIALALAAVLAERSVDAQTFQYGSKGNAPALIGFRRPSSPNDFELVANLGNVITNIENLTPGTTFVFTNRLLPTQLANAYPNSFDDVHWSVSAAFTGLSYNGFQGGTIWYTLPRVDVNTQTTPPQRHGNGQVTVGGNMTSVGEGAKNDSGTLSSNINNTIYTVREPNPTSTQNNYSFWVADTSDAAIGTFGLGDVVENTIPSPFSSAIRSDFYRARPLGYTDPETGLTSGAAYYLGYFQLDPNGNLSFTRVTPSTTTQSAPPPPVLSMHRVGMTNTISFATTNGAIYKLYFTNSVGLETSLTNWPSISTNITGTGGISSFMDITTDTVRFYGITAH